MERTGILATPVGARSRVAANPMEAATAEGEASVRRSLETLQRTLWEHKIISITDRAGTIIEVNPAFCAISGYSREELIGKNHRIVNSGRHPRTFWAEVWRTIASGTAWRGDVCNRAKDGSLYWVRMIIAPMRGEGDRIERYVSIRHDITPQKRLEEEAARNTEELSRRLVQRDELLSRLGKLGSLIPGVIYQYREWPDGRRTMPYASEGIRRIFGVEAREVVEDATVLWSRIHAEDVPRVEESVRVSARDLTPWRERYRVRRTDGEERWVGGHATPERLGERSGGGTLWHGIITDVTEQRRAEMASARMAEVIERQNENLRAMADRAHRVVDDVSHEFRTPLAVIKEFASIIADGVAGPVTAPQAEYLKIMDGAVIDLNHMVEDLLDSSKLRAGRLRVERRGHRLEAIVAPARPALQRKASSRALVIEERYGADLAEVFADEEKVRRVLGNLVTNAIKFSPEGGVIRIDALRDESGPGATGRVVVRVTDQGQGLTREEMDVLFGRFQQVSTARSVAAKGFGLGLSIAHELSWLNLGTLGVSSEKGHGATFWFTLPVNEPASIVEHFFETAARSERPGETLALIRARSEWSGGGAAQDLGAFLASVTYATDLVAPAEDESARPGGGGWWVMGRTGDPEMWVKRLRGAYEALAAEGGEEIPPMRIDLAGQWAYPAEAEAARRAIRGVLMKEVRHG